MVYQLGYSLFTLLTRQAFLHLLSVIKADFCNANYQEMIGLPEGVGFNVHESSSWCTVEFEFKGSEETTILDGIVWPTLFSGCAVMKPTLPSSAGQPTT